MAFYDHELPRGAPNLAIPLLVQAGMANFDVRRVVIDTGSSCDIMYTGMLKTLKQTESNLAPYVGTELYGFNSSSTKLWGRRQDENNNDPIPSDRLHLPLQPHHWEDWTNAAWGRMLNCPHKAKISRGQQHNTNPARRHRGCSKVLLAGK